jgi:excisionase family DNA binding protein
MSKEIIYVSEVEIQQMISSAVNTAIEKRLYSLAEAAEFLGIGEQALRKSKHLIGFVKIGNKIIFKGTDLHKYLEQNYVGRVGA